MDKLRNLYYGLSPQMRLAARKLYYLPIDMWETVTNKRHKYEPPKGDIYIGRGDFISQGKHHLEVLKRHIDLHPDDSVLDVGSGIGRSAVALTDYLSQNGKYEGFDVVEKGVRWCNNKIGRDYPNFKFTYTPLNNDLYNTKKKKAVDFTFPYPDNSFEKVFLFSVFTHMMIDEIAHYLKEIERVLKPGGMCLSTFFVYNKEDEKWISNNNDFSFPVVKEDYRLMHENVKSANIALSEGLLSSFISEAKLKKEVIKEGYWKQGINRIEDY